MTRARQGAVLALLGACACHGQPSMPAAKDVHVADVACAVHHDPSDPRSMQADPNAFYGPDACEGALKQFFRAHPDDRIWQVIGISAHPPPYATPSHMQRGTQKLAVVYTDKPAPWPRARDLEVNYLVCTYGDPPRSVPEPTEIVANDCATAIAAWLPDGKVDPQTLWVAIDNDAPDAHTPGTQALLMIATRHERPSPHDARGSD